MHQFSGLRLLSHLTCRWKHGMVTHKAIRTVHSETSGVNQETNVSVIDTLDSSCLMERDPTESRKA